MMGSRRQEATVASEGRGGWRRIADWFARQRRRWRGVEPRARIEIRCDRVAIGGWCICPQAVRKGDVVYSFGVGGDLSFERGLAVRFGARVFAFDPAPATAELAAATSHPLLRFQALTVGGREGRDEVRLPGGGTVQARMLRLQSHMRLLGHRRVDIVRLDVPGAEGDVIRDLVRTDVDVQQLLVAFREPPSPDARRRTEAALGALAEHGYRIFHLSPDGREISLIRTETPAR